MKLKKTLTCIFRVVLEKKNAIVLSETSLECQLFLVAFIQNDCIRMIVTRKLRRGKAGFRKNMGNANIRIFEKHPEGS